MIHSKICVADWLRCESLGDLLGVVLHGGVREGQRCPEGLLYSIRKIKPVQGDCGSLFIPVIIYFVWNYWNLFQKLYCQFTSICLFLAKLWFDWLIVYCQMPLTSPSMLSAVQSQPVPKVAKLRWPETEILSPNSGCSDVGHQLIYHLSHHPFFGKPSENIRLNINLYVSGNTSTRRTGGEHPSSSLPMSSNVFHPSSEAMNMIRAKKPPRRPPVRRPAEAPLEVKVRLGVWGVVGGGGFIAP